MKEPLHVAAAVIRRDGRILICRRGPGGSCAGLWEFPGGKVEAGETAQTCAVRECREELGVEVAAGKELWRTRYQYPDREVALTFLEARWIQGTPTPLVHLELRWVLPAELVQFDFCPADRELIERLAQDEI